MEFTDADLCDLRRARRLLETGRFATRLIDLLGVPVEKGFKLIPARWSETVGDASRAALRKALKMAVLTLGDAPGKRSSDFGHKLMAGAAGAAGGALGIAALAVELPLSTTIMLRSVADIARSEGEDLKDIHPRLACLEVFALGGKSASGDAADMAYFAVRYALARQVSEAAAYIAQRGLAEEGAPMLVRLLGTIGSRFGALVSEKLAAQAVPIVGAAGGALINTLFIDHFQDVARGHFTVRRLERTYGAAAVRQRYDDLQM